MDVSIERWWTVQHGPGPVVATAIHNGHDLRRDVLDAIALGDAERLREEDPFTGEAVRNVPLHIIAHRSRFEFDLNRDDFGAIYRAPEQCWGLELWRQGEPNEALVSQSLAIHAEYYRMLGSLLDGLAARCRHFLLIDVHSYNHRRDGPNAPPAPQDQAPDVNIGTSSMPREQWAFLVDPLIADMRAFDFNGRHLDVRENIAFQGRGMQTRFVHERYPGRGCAIALEFKKFFMDEWTGAPDGLDLDAMQRFIAHAADFAADLLA